MNSEYLITKTMNNYDQKLNKSFIGGEGIEDNIKQINKLLGTNTQLQPHTSNDNHFLKVDNRSKIYNNLEKNR